MNDLPVPKIRASWVSAVILTCISFLVYYLFFFDRILESYQKQFFNETVTLEDENVNLEITAHIPRYVYSSNAVWAYIDVRNLGQTSLSNVNIYLNTDVTDRSYTYMLPEIYEDEDDIYNTGIEFKTIQQSEITSGRLRFLSQSQAINIKGVIVTVGESDPVSLNFGAIQPIRWNSWALKHSFFENILLPPWSNGLIFALSLFSAYLVHKKEKMTSDNSQSQENSRKEDDDEQDILTDEWFKSVGNNLLRSSIFLLFVIGLILVFLNAFVLFVVEILLYPVLVLILVRKCENFLRWLLVTFGAILSAFSIILIVDLCISPKPFSDPYPLLPFGIGWSILVSTILTVTVTIFARPRIVLPAPVNKKELDANSKKQEKTTKKSIKKKSEPLFAFWNKRYKSLKSNIKKELREIHKNRPKDEILWMEFYKTDPQRLESWREYIEQLKRRDYKELRLFWRWVDKIYESPTLAKIRTDEEWDLKNKTKPPSQPGSNTKPNE